MYRFLNIYILLISIIHLTVPSYGQVDSAFIPEEITISDGGVEFEHIDHVTAKKQSFLTKERVVFGSVILFLLLGLGGAILLLKQKTQLIKDLEINLSTLEDKYAMIAATINQFRKKEDGANNPDKLYAQFPPLGQDILNRRQDIYNLKNAFARLMIEDYEPITGEALFSVIDDLSIHAEIINNEFQQLLTFCTVNTIDTTGKTGIIMLARGRVKKIGKVWKLIEKANVQLV